VAEFGKWRTVLIWAALAENPSNVQQLHFLADPSCLYVVLVDVPPSLVDDVAAVGPPILFERVVGAGPSHDIAYDSRVASVAHSVDRRLCSRLGNR